MSPILVETRSQSEYDKLAGAKYERLKSCEDRRKAKLSGCPNWKFCRIPALHDKARKTFLKRYAREFDEGHTKFLEKYPCPPSWKKAPRRKTSKPRKGTYVSNPYVHYQKKKRVSATDLVNLLRGGDKDTNDQKKS
jgi:hypothetical protein